MPSKPSLDARPLETTLEACANRAGMNWYCPGVTLDEVLAVSTFGLLELIVVESNRLALFSF